FQKFSADSNLILRPQAIVPTRNEIEISTVAKHLELLPNLLFHMPILRINATQSVFKGIDAVEIEFTFSDQLDAFHHFYQPSPGFYTFITKEERLAPLFDDFSPVLQLTVPDEEYLPRFGNLAQEDIAADPSSSSCRGRQGFTSLNDLTHEEMLRYHE